MKIKNNSKKIKKNDIFVATTDNFFNRGCYIDKALDNGAGLVITNKMITRKNKYILNVENPNLAYYNLLNNYYDEPFKKIDLIGITGTDGKTTTAIIINYILSNFKKCAYLGTNGFIYDKKKIRTNNTTPDLEEIFKFGNILSRKKYDYLVMETSSEGLLHNRCYNLKFKRTILTNVTVDHLNIHKNINNYLESKLKLFKNVTSDGICILNIDDNNFKYFKNNISGKILTYGSDKAADYYFYNENICACKTIFTLKHLNNKYVIKSPLLGKFNIYNLVAAIACLNSLGIDIQEIIDCINKDLKIDGRMNLINYGQNYKIILDYAHTQRATLCVLSFIKSIKKKRVITVVGCAGGRYKEKRSKIGKIVSDLSDIAIFTKDDPRNEDVNDIINEMRKDCEKNNINVITNRKKAIRYALDIARADDIVLILGKGLDDYMAIGNKHKSYSDIRIIKRYFTKVF